MTKILSISFLVVMLILQTPVCQLMKLPVLVEHYFEHKHADGDDTGILDYLAIHYLSDVKQGDYERDMQLPFKQSSPSFLLIVYFTPRTIELPLSESQPIKRDHSFYHRSFHTTESLAKVWQPPRILNYA